MLILNRKVGEAIVVDFGDRQVVVEVRKVRGGKVWLGIDGDRDIPVHRGELVSEPVAGRPQS